MTGLLSKGYDTDY